MTATPPETRGLLNTAIRVLYLAQNPKLSESDFAAGILLTAYKDRLALAHEVAPPSPSSAQIFLQEFMLPGA